MKSIRELHEQYGIPYVERTKTYPAEDFPVIGGTCPPGQVNPAIIEAGERVMDEHRDLLKALAKR